MISIPLSSCGVRKLMAGISRESNDEFGFGLSYRKTDENETKEILQNIYTFETNNKEKIRTIFQDASAIIPVASNHNCCLCRSKECFGPYC